MRFLLIALGSLCLSACAPSGPKAVSYGNDALPSAEVLAFQRVDARLKYRNATIERDAANCAVYRGTASDGQVRSEPLTNEAGQPICVR